jgi:hypothetical protein
MAAKTTPAAAPADPFAGLLETAEVSEKRVSVDRSAIVVPQEWIERVEWAYDNSKRVTLKVTDKDMYTNVANLIRAAADKSVKDITATCVARYEGDGDDAKLTGLTFTVGNRRGQKKGKSVGDAPVAK